MVSKPGSGVPHSDALRNILFDQSADGIIVADADGLCLDVNPRFCQLSGYSREECLQSTIDGILSVDHPADRAGQDHTRQRGHIRHKLGSLPETEVTRRILRDGTRVYIVHGAPWTSDAEQRLHEKEATIASIFRAAPVGIGMVVDRVILEANDYLCMMVGYRREELIGKNSRLLYPTDDDYEFVGREKYRRIAETGMGTVETRWLDKSGNILDILLSSTPLDVTDLAKGVIFTALDITERKRVEQALTESELRLRRAQAVAHVGDWELDVAAMTIRGSEEARKVYGLDTSEKSLPLHVIQQCVLPEYRSQLDKALHRLVNEGQPYNEVFRIKRVDNGEIRFIHSRAERTIHPSTGQTKVIGIIQDISEHKHSEEILQRYQLLFHNARDIMLFVRVSDGHILEANKAAERAYGYEREDLLAKNIRALRAPTTMSTIAGQIEAADTAGTSFETVHVRKNGSLFPVEVNAMGITFGGERVLLSIVRDITARKRADQALRMFQHSIDQSSDAIFWINRDAGFTYVNDQACASLGYTREELMALRLWDIDPVYPKEVWASNWERYQINRQGGGENVETLHRRKDGTIFPVDVSSTHLWFDDDELHVAVVRDITERKKAEEALRESEERYRTTLYSIGDGVVTTDLHGNVLQMNRAAEQMTGWTETDSAARPVQEIVHLVLDGKEEHNEHPVNRVLTIRSALEFGDSYTLIARAGKRRPISLGGAPIRDGSGNVTGVVLVFNDLTERQELETQLRQAQKLEAIGRLAGGVAHDFNNMIGVILGYASLLKSSLKPLDPLHKHADAIVRAAERSSNLTKQLLAFARRQIVAPVPVNLNDALASLERMLVRLIGEDITLNIVRSEGLWNIRIDPTQVDQILANLSTNARDAIDDVGAITIETHNIVISGGQALDHPDVAPGEYVMLSFADTGRGMDRITRERVFEPFFTTKAQGHGTGLGLATVFGIIKQNNGFINVDSEPGHGTTFRIYLPRFAGPVASPTPKEAELPLQGSEAILIVEDEPQFLDLTAETLKAFGYTVLLAKSPGAAIMLCQQTGTRIDLLLTDVVLPEMNGKELSELVSGMKPGLKTLFMSGYTADVVAHRGILDEGTNFIQKPFTPPALARKVREVLNG